MSMVRKEETSSSIKAERLLYAQTLHVPRFQWKQYFQPHDAGQDDSLQPSLKRRHDPLS